MWKKGPDKVTENLIKSAESRGWTIIPTKQNKKSIKRIHIFKDGSKGPQLWTKLSNKDGEIMLIEVETGKNPHVHIHLGENKLEPKGWK